MDSLPDRLESAVISRLMWRLMPFLFLLYIVAYLDRINVSFGVLQMRGQLGLSDRVYGRAAGIFFAGYFLFQLPSNLVLEKFGVRRWISALMILWGVISCLMIFIRGPISFYSMRFVLGAAEAGFFPGIILYMKRWFPASARATAVAWFMTANPLAGVVGSPISGSLLGLHGGGLAGWQWMFLLEGLPAILLGAAVYATLADKPQEAHWLKGVERAWLLEKLNSEARSETKVDQSDFWKVLVSPRIWLLSMIYFGVSTTMYGVTLWLPTVIRSFSGLSYFWTGHDRHPSVPGGRAGDGSDWKQLRSIARAALAHRNSGIRCRRRIGWGGLRKFDSGRCGGHRGGACLRRKHVWTFLGNGDLADGRALGRRRNRCDQFARESRRLLWPRYHRILSHRKRRISWRFAVDRRGAGH